jgi:uncharacterized protein (TIGR03067 family)
MADDLEKLQGNWHVTALELDGRDMPAEPFEGAMIVIENKNFASLNMGATYEGTDEIDETTEPKSFDRCSPPGRRSALATVAFTN